MSRHKPMTDDELDAIKGRLKNITPPPWFHVLASIVGTKDDPESPDATCVCCTEWGYCGDDPQANAEFIAAAPTDISRLLAEVERLRQENKRLCGELERRDEEISSLERDLDFTSLEQYILAEKLFNSRICHKDILCEQEDPKNWKFEGQGGCKNCWDEWARHLASDAIEEAELNAE